MTAPTTSAERRAVRSTIHARLAAIAPDGILWLASQNLAHPEAARAPRLAFPFVIGRLAQGRRHHTVREAELVLATLEPGQDMVTLLDYAHFVVATAPTVHARLSGQVLAAWRSRTVPA